MDRPSTLQPPSLVSYLTTAIFACLQPVSVPPSFGHTALNAVIDEGLQDFQVSTQGIVEGLDEHVKDVFTKTCEGLDDLVEERLASLQRERKEFEVERKELERKEFEVERKELAVERKELAVERREFEVERKEFEKQRHLGQKNFSGQSRKRAMSVPL
jgi:hypothetical protein